MKNKIPYQIKGNNKAGHAIPYQVEKNNKAGHAIILLVILVFLAGLVSAIPQTFNVHGKLSNSSGALTGTYDMNFSLYNVYVGGGYLWNGAYSVTTDGDGVYNIILYGVGGENGA